MYHTATPPPECKPRNKTLIFRQDEYHALQNASSGARSLSEYAHTKLPGFPETPGTQLVERNKRRVRLTAAGTQAGEIAAKTQHIRHSLFDLPTEDGQVQPLIATKWVTTSPLVIGRPVRAQISFAYGAAALYP